MRAMFDYQCKNKKIQISNEVQSFSVLGLVIVVTITILLIIIALSLESCVLRFKSKTSNAAIARHADEKLQLLRMAIDNSDLQWNSGGAGDIPVTGSTQECPRPRRGSNGLPSYPTEYTQTDNTINLQPLAYDGMYKDQQSHEVMPMGVQYYPAPIR